MKEHGEKQTSLTLKKAAKAVLPVLAVMGGGLFASSRNHSASSSIGRRLKSSSAIVTGSGNDVPQELDANATLKAHRSAFGVFSKSERSVKPVSIRPNSNALAFLEKNGLFKPGEQVLQAEISGNIEGRKQFLHSLPFSQNFYTNTNCTAAAYNSFSYRNNAGSNTITCTLFDTNSSTVSTVHNWAQCQAQHAKCMEHGGHSGGAPEMNVQGNNVDITDGDSSPSSADHTDFGSNFVGGSNVVRTFTIQNTGTADLDLTNSPNVSITGSTDFTISSQPSLDPISAAGSTTFQVTLDPTTVGLQTATISIANDDADENPYNFNVAATVQAPVVLTVITSNSSAVKITATGDNAYSNNGSDAANFPIQLKSFFSSDPGTATYSDGSSTLQGPNAINLDSLLGGRSGPSQTTAILRQGSGTAETFSTASAAFSGSATFDLSSISALLPSGGSTGNITTDNAGLEIIGSWQVLAVDVDGTLTASATVTEPVNLGTTIDSAIEAVNLFDFTIADGGTSDGVAMSISQIIVNVSGTSTDAERADVTWRLSGPDAANVSGSYSAVSDTITFSGLNISVADGLSETYTINAYFNDNSAIVEDRTFILSIDGDTDVTVSGGTHFGSTSPVTNGIGGTWDVVATVLDITTQPAGSVSGAPFTTQPVLQAEDAFGNLDVDFSEEVSASTTAGTLTDTTATAVAGVATFTDLAHEANSDGQGFIITFDDAVGGLNLSADNSNLIFTDVVATSLEFSTQPAGSVSGSNLTTQPVVRAVGPNSVIDTGFTETITLTESSLGTLSGTAVAAVNGVATFTSVNYTASADQESVTLTADDQTGVGSDLSSVDANAFTADVVATTLAFTTQPSPLSIFTGEAISFTTVPVVAARDANGVVDTGYSTAISLAEVNGAGSATLSSTGDTDGDAATVTLTPTAGVATFTGLQMTYTNSGGSSETLNLQASSGGLTTADSSQLTSAQPPSITSATYNAGTGVLVVTGVGFLSEPGAGNDVDVSLLSLTGANGASYSLTSSDVDIDSPTQFTISLNTTDVLNLNGILNANGTTSADVTTYNLAAADDWLPAAVGIPDVSDTTGNTVTVSGVSAPTLTSAVYNAGTGALVITGTNFVKYPGSANDLDISTLSLLGDGNNSYTLTSTDVEISSRTTASLLLNAVDRLAVGGLLNANGTTSDDGTTYNIAAADNWLPAVAPATDIADLTSNAITVSGVSASTVSSATYDASTRTLIVTGSNFVNEAGAANDVDISTLTITGDGGNTYTLTSDDVEVASATQFSVTLNDADALVVNGLLNANGTQSADSTNYNIAAADNWMAGAAASVNIADTSNGITVSGVSSPTVTSATYDAATGVLVVTGTNLVAYTGANNDVTVSTLTLTGSGGNSYTLTSSSVEVTDATSFSITLNAADRLALGGILNANGTIAGDATSYNLAAADNWQPAAAAVVDISDTSGNAVTVSNVSAPTITSMTYDASTGVLVVTGANFVGAVGANNDVDVSLLTLVGENGATYTLTSSDIEVTSSTQFSITLNSTDQLNVNGLLNANGTASGGGTTYNLDAADDWMAGANGTTDISDSSGNGVTVSNVSVPAVTSAVYNAGTGALVISGSNFVKYPGGANDLDVSTLSFLGDGNNSYTLTSTDVEIASTTTASLLLNAADRLAVGGLLNANGITSDDGTTYNLAAADNWLPGAADATDIADITGNGITVSGVSAPSISSATYDASTGVLIVTGSQLVGESGAANDVDVSALTITGEGNNSYTLTSTDVEVTSASSFSLTLNSTDVVNVNGLLNVNGTTSSGGTTYNLAAADNWLPGAAASVNIADVSGNGITVSGAAVPTVTSATYNAGSGALVVTGSRFVAAPGANNDVDVSDITFTGEGGATYTLTSAVDVDITSATEFSVTLSGTDLLHVNGLLNANGTSSDDSTLYNVAFADDFIVNASAGSSDDATNGVTVSGVVLPSVTSATYDASTGDLVVTGLGFVANTGAANDVDVTKLSLTGEAGNSYTLTSTNVEISSATELTITLSTADLLNINGLLNADGTASDDSTAYNLATADNWMTASAASVDSSDLSNGVTVSNVSLPTLTSATYNAATGALVVTGTNLRKQPGATNDVDVSALVVTGSAGGTRALTASSDIEITSATSFSLVLATEDKTALDALLNNNGTSADDATTYNLAASDNWLLGAAASVDIADLTGNGITASNVPDVDGNLTASVLVTEPVGLSTAVTSAGSAVNVMDFTLSDGGTEDGFPLGVSEWVIHVAGTSTDAERSQITWRLNGPDVVNEEGVYDAATDTLTFSSLSISVIDGGNETYTLSAFYNDASNITEDHTYILSVDGDSDLTIVAGGTLMGATSELNNSDNGRDATFDVIATGLSFLTAPAGSVSGSALTTQPVVVASDAAGNTDVDFTGTVVLSELSAGSASGNAVAAVGGVATFTNLIYSASADQESFTLTASATGVSSASAGAVTSDVVATALVFTTQPAGAVSGLALTTQPVVTARDANGLTDTGFTQTVTLSEVSSGSLSNASVSAVAGVATFSGTTYTASADQESFTLTASATGVTGASSNAVTADVVATQLVFTTQPAPLDMVHGTPESFTSVPVVVAQDADGSTDTGYATDIVLAAVNGTGSAAMSGTGDLDGDSATVTLAPSAGVVTFADLQMTYTNSGTSDETFNLEASSGGLTSGVSNVLTSIGKPVISGATYDYASGVLAVSGAGFVASAGGADVDASLLTLTGQGNASHTLTTTADVEITSPSSFVITLSAEDALVINGLLNRDGLSSDDSTAYNLAAGEDWMLGSEAAVDIADSVSGVTVSNVSVPTITSISYDADTGILTVTGTGFVKQPGADNDVDVSTITVTGQGGQTYTLVSTPDVEITSATAFSVTLDSTDKAQVDALLTEGGTSSDDDTTYNLAVADNWMPGAAASSNIADTTGNVITASNVDATAPSVTGVTSVTADGNYVGTDVIAITVTFDEPVYVTGTPQLQLETGDIDRDAIYDSGSATAVLTFLYTVQSGDYTADLDYLSSSALTLNGGAITDLALNDADLSLVLPGQPDSLGDAKALVVDAAAPTEDSNSALQLNEGASALISATELSFSDTISPAADITFTVDAVPQNGSLSLDGVVLSLSETFTQVDIDAGLLSYSHIGDETLTDAFTFTVSDALGNGVSGQVFSIGVTPVNDPPVVTSSEVTSAAEDVQYRYALSATDAENDELVWTAAPGSALPSWATIEQPSIRDSAFAGVGTNATSNGGVYDSADGTLATEAMIGINAIDFRDGKLFMSDSEEYGVRFVDQDGTVQTFFAGDGEYTTLNPTGVAYNDVSGVVYVSDYGKGKVVQITDQGVMSDLASGLQAFVRDLLWDSQNDKLYVAARSAIYEVDLTNADATSNSRIVVGDSSGTGSYADTGTASTSMVSEPRGMALDSNGRLVFVDRNNHLVRRLDLLADTIETLAGDQSVASNAGDGGPAVAATFGDPTGLAIDSRGHIYVTERLDRAVRKLDVDTGDITTLYTYSGSGFVEYVRVDESDQLYVSTSNHVQILSDRALLTGTPAQSDVGDHNVCLVANDGTDNSAEQCFTITVTAVNDAPTVGVNSAASLDEGAVLAIGNTLLAAADVDDADVGLIFTVTTVPQNGTLFVDQNDNGQLNDGEALIVAATFTQQDVDAGNLYYLHDGSDTLADNFNFTLEDGGEDGVAPVTGQQFAFVVAPVNDTPTLVLSASNPTYTEDQAGSGLFSGASASVVESGQTLSGFALTVSNLSDGDDEQLVVDGVVIALIDGNTGATATAGLNYAVSVTGSTATVTFSDGTLTAEALQSVLNGMTYQNTSDAPTAGVDRVVTVTSVTDSGGGEDTASLALSSTVTVVSVNDAPVISGTPEPTVNEDSAYSFTPVATDIDGDALAFSIANQPEWADFDTATGQLTGTPENEHVSTFNDIVISVSDGEETVSLASFDLQVINVNDAPEPETDSYTLNEGALLSPDIALGVLANDVDIDGDSLEVSLVTGPTRATSFSLNADGSFSYQHNGGEGRTDGFTYTVSDGTVVSAPVTVALSMTPVNDPPAFTSEPPSTSVVQGQIFRYRVGVNDSDSVVQLTLQDGPDWLTLSGGLLSGTAPLDALGQAAVVVRAADGEYTVDQSFSLNILERETAVVDIVPTWLGTPSIAGEDIALRIRLNHVQGPAVTGGVLRVQVQGDDLTLGLAGCTAAAEQSWNCPVSLAEGASTSFSLQLNPGSDGNTVVILNLDEANGESLAVKITDVTTTDTAVSQGNLRFDIAKATALASIQLVDDGDKELVAGTSLGETVKLVNYDLSTLEGTQLGEIDNRGETEQIKVADIDQDSLDDMVVVNSNGDATQVYYARGPLTFETEATNQSFAYASEALLRDLNDDGFPELILAGSGFDVYIYQNNAGVYDQSPYIFNSPSSVVHFALLKRQPADAPLTGTLALSSQDAVLLVRFGLGVSNEKTGSTETTAPADSIQKTELSQLDIPGVTSIRVADLDGDGTEELVLSTEHENNSAEKSGVTIVGISDAGVMTPLVKLGSASAKTVEVADFNGDGNPDLMVANDNASYQFYYGQGGADQFVLKDTVIYNESTLVIPEDVNNDGLADVLIYESELEAVEVYVSAVDGSQGANGDLMVQTSVAAASNRQYSMTYTVEIANQGDAEAEGVEIQLTLPSGIGAASLPENCVAEEQWIFCEMGTLASGETAAIDLGLISTENPSALSVSTSVKSDLAEQSPTDNTTSTPLDGVFTERSVTVRGGGKKGGAVGMELWLFLAVLILLQQTGRGSGVRKRLKAGGLLLAAAAALSAQVNAENLAKEVSETNAALSGQWYAEVSAGRADTHWNSGAFSRKLDQASVEAELTGFDNRRTSINFVVGKRMNSWISVEGGYQDWGKVSLTLDATVSSSGALNTLIRNDYPLSGKGPVVGVRASYFDAKRSELYIKAGLWMWESSYDVFYANGDRFRFNKEGTDLYLGVGSTFKVTDALRVGMTYQTAELDGQVVGNVQLSLGVDF